MERLKQPKVILALALVVLAAIVFWQNQQPVVVGPKELAQAPAKLPMAKWSART